MKNDKFLTIDSKLFVCISLGLGIILGLQIGVHSALISGKSQEIRIFNESSASSSLIDSNEDQSISANKVLTTSQEIKLKEIRKLARSAGHGHPESITVFDSELCYKNDCLDAAKEFFTSMDMSKNPCTEWRKFACEWRTLSSKSAIDQLSAVTLSAESQVQDILQNSVSESETIELAHEYFRACQVWFQGSNKVNIVSKYLKSFGNWPLLTGLDYEGNWVNVLVAIVKTVPDNVSPFLLKFDAAAVNDKNIVLQINFGLTYLEMESEDIQDLLHILRGKGSHNNIEEEIREMKKCMQLLSLEKFNADLKTNPTLVTLKSLQEKLTAEIPSSKLSLIKLMQSVFAGTDIKLSDETEVLANTQNLIKYLKIVESVSEKALVNILFLQLATVLLGDTTNALEESGYLYLKNYMRYLSRSSSHQCIVETSEVFSFALSEEYVRRYFDEKNKELITNITEHLRVGFLKTLGLVKWIPESAKQSLTERIKDLKPLIGFPSWTLNNTHVSEYYSNLKLPESTNILDELLYLKYRNVVLGWLNGKSWTMKLYDDIMDGWNYQRHNGFVGDTNIEYFSALNQIRIPTGILQPPLYSVDFPGFMNFGGIGSIIAREMARIVDPTDSDWWSDEKSLKGYQDWSLRLQAEWESDMNLKDKVMNVIAYHITVNGYDDWSKSLKMDGREELKLPGLAEQQPEKLLQIKYTNVFCQDEFIIKRSTEVGDRQALHSRYDIIPVTETKQFLKIFNCETERVNTAFDLV